MLIDFVKRWCAMALFIRETGEGVPVLFVHGNLSDGSAWREQLGLLPPGFRGIAPDLRGFGRSEPAPIDATRGVGDFRDDLVLLLDELGLGAVHLVGHSMGGGVVMDLATRHPERALTITVVAPVSPYGFGGTRLDGTPCTPDFAGTGGGTANPELVKLIRDGDTSDAGPMSPRDVVRTLYFPGADAVRNEEELLAGVLATRIGEDHYPGDATPSPHWPGRSWPGTARTRSGSWRAPGTSRTYSGRRGSPGCCIRISWAEDRGRSRRRLRAVTRRHGVRRLPAHTAQG
jgi:pimeloyl-ACP methyl ester carboxylesterase